MRRPAQPWTPAELACLRAWATAYQARRRRRCDLANDLARKLGRTPDGIRAALQYYHLWDREKPPC